MARDPDWSHWRSFLAVLDAGALSGAARALGVAQPTVGRHIEALEADLGAGPLFTRSPGGLTPTRAALALEPQARAMAAAAGALLRAAASDAGGLSGVVRISASDIMAAEILPPILTGLREDQPRLDIELSATNRMEDLLRRDVDIAVRMVRPTQDALLARRIGETELIFYGHRSYIQRHGQPVDLDDLRRHTLIGYDRVRPPMRALERLPVEVSREMFSLRCDSELAQLAMLRAGYGLCPVQTRIARRDPNLVPVLEGRFSFALEVWVSMHEALKTEPRMRLVFDRLAEGLRSWLEG